SQCLVHGGHHRARRKVLHSADSRAIPVRQGSFRPTGKGYVPLGRSEVTMKLPAVGRHESYQAGLAAERAYQNVTKLHVQMLAGDQGTPQVCHTTHLRRAGDSCSYLPSPCGRGYPAFLPPPLWGRVGGVRSARDPTPIPPTLPHKGGREPDSARSSVRNPS